MDLGRLEVEFLRLGVQYYTSARSSFLAQQVPVSGNLFHHAIEMLLKARLCHRIELARLKHHRLKKLWSEFKKDFPERTDLAPFDVVVSRLDKFEEVRYPDRVVLKGAFMGLAWEASDLPTHKPRSLREYVLAVNDLDALVAKIFEVSSRNLAFFGPFNNYSKDAITRENPQPSLIPP
jgi:hypothetical protein